MEWTEIETNANAEKCFHSAVLLNNKIFTFGGNNQIPAYVPPYILNLGNAHGK
jgi:hypothetical protein